MHVRLKDTGSFERSDTEVVSQDGSSLDKRCLLVYAGKFDSMDGEVTITPEHLKRLADNHNGLLAKMKRLAGTEEVPVKHMPPVQLDHSTSSKDTVGRLRGLLEMGSHTLEDGSSVPALFGTARILGKENVERVKDGRWVNLSIGADLDVAKLTELTITPFPAAPEASMLSKVRMAASMRVDEYPVSTDGHVKWCYHIVVDGKPVYSSYGYDQREEAEASAKKALDRIGKHSTTLSAVKDETELPGHVDEALWDKAKRASQEAFNEIRWPFVMWWYEEHGGKTTSKTSKMGGEPMHPHAHLHDHLKKLGVKEQDKIEHYLGRLKKHLMDHHEMEDEEAHQHMAEMKPDHYDMYARHMRHMGEHKMEHADDPMPHSESTVDMEKSGGEMPPGSGEEHMEEEKYKHMSAAEKKAEIVKLQAAINTSSNKIALAAKKSKIQARLSKLRSQAKITPAEVKKLDIAKLAAMDDKSIDLMMSAFEAMEPKVFVGMHGTTKAEDLSKYGEEYRKKLRMSKLEAEVRANMGSVNKKPGEDPMGEIGAKRMDAVDVHVDPEGDEEYDVHSHPEMESDYDNLKKLIGEGKHEEAKEHLKHMIHKHMKHMKHMAGEETHPSEHDVSEIHEEMKHLRSQVKSLTQLMGS